MNLSSRQGELPDGSVEGMNTKGKSGAERKSLRFFKTYESATKPCISPNLATFLKHQLAPPILLTRHNFQSPIVGL